MKPSHVHAKCLRLELQAAVIELPVAITVNQSLPITRFSQGQGIQPRFQCVRRFRSTWLGINDGWRDGRFGGLLLGIAVERESGNKGKEESA